ncbi:uncharacterized protein C6G9.01c [Carica papaya]|uniref:uncharacterized protein C6G9.01c n=1 Tax=Carica papaya TaxID=3649 RepID=UPI000B8D10E1|nr:uncharacterized protein C6G9.01c [Carica papaya]
MPRKGSSKTPTKKENPVVEEEKPTSKSKELSKEIDEIFAGKKRKKPELKKENGDGEGTPKNKEKKKKKTKKKSKGDTDDGFEDLPARPRKKTEDGLTIYTEVELGMSKANAGGTPLCPFDCDCCF